VHRVDDGLDPDGVAHDEELAETAIEECDREDAVELGREADAFFFVEVGEDLGVAPGVQRVTAAHEVFSQLGVVVDQPIEDDDHVAVLVGHGLGAAGRVEDREAAIAQTHPVADVEALAVRPAVDERVGHGADERLIAEAERSGDTAHQWRLLRPELREPKFDSK
jgi:hypothetical protein